MKSVFCKMLALTLMCGFCLLLCACEREIVNNADELVCSKWQLKSEKGYSVTLSFSGDNALMQLETDGGYSARINGFCEISTDAFVIHDKATLHDFAFLYNLKSDSVDIMYDGYTLSLSKI